MTAITENENKYAGFKPRNYQIEMYQRAKKENVIVKLNTGSGKTFIAVMLIKHYIHETNKPLDEGGKRIVFLVKNVHLVTQQAAAIRKHLPYDNEKAVGMYYGEISPGEWIDFWSEDQWKKVFNSHRVVVITAGVFKDMLNHNKFSLKDVCLLIFDECHHTAKADDYAQICDHLKPFNLARRAAPHLQHGPRILGLTASVLNGNIKTNRIPNNIEELENMLGARLVTSFDADAASFARDTKEEIVYYRPSDMANNLSYAEMLEIMEASLEEVSPYVNASPSKTGATNDIGMTVSLVSLEENLPKKAKRALSDCVSVLNELGPWCCKRVLLNYVRELESVQTRSFNPSSVKAVQIALEGLNKAAMIYDAKANDERPFISDKCKVLIRQFVDYHKMFTERSESQEARHVFPGKNSKPVGLPVAIPSTSTAHISKIISKLDEVSVTTEESDSDYLVNSTPTGNSSSVDMDEEEESNTYQQRWNDYEDNSDNDSLYYSDEEEEGYSSSYSSYDSDERTRLTTICNDDDLNEPSSSSEESTTVKQTMKDYGFHGLVFVQQRQYAYALCELMKHMIKQYSQLDFLRIEHVTGHGLSSLQPKEVQMTLANQEKVLCRFRSGEINLLIATRVVEEGMDVQECNLVIKFDVPEEFRSYVQSKGRARAAESHYVILAPEDKQGPAQYKMDLYQQMDKIITDSIRNRSIELDREDDRERDEEDTDYDIDDLFMPKGPGGPRITLNSAMSVVNRYVSKLRQDSLIPLRAEFEIEKLNDGVRGLLTLPMPCPIVETISGRYAQNKRTAKQYVALKTCRLLYEQDELDECLLPRDRKFESDDSDEDYEEGGLKTGTNKKLRHYAVGLASALSVNQSPVSAKHDVYLYSIDFDPIVTEMIKLRRPNFTHTNLSVGLLFAEPVAEHERVARFPMFLPGGRSQVIVKLCNVLSLTQKEFNSATASHRTLLECLFPVGPLGQPSALEGLTLNLRVAKLPWLIVVLDDRECSIDWCMTNFLAEQTSKPRNLIDVDRSLWKGSTILPRHNLKDRGYWILDEVMPNLTADSAFPETSKASSYANYFELVYRATMKRTAPKEQPLVEGKRLNGVRGALNSQAWLETGAKIRRTVNTGPVYLIPEFVEWLPVPAFLMVQLRCLPFVLYRFNQLLLTNELHSQLFLEMGMSPSPWSELVLDDDVAGIEVQLDDQEDGEVEDILRRSRQVSVTNLLEAFTTINCRDYMNLERLEMLGDSYLKYIVSVHLHATFRATQTEGVLSSERRKVISNKNLYRLAKERGLHRFLWVRAFEQDVHFLPPGYAVGEEGRRGLPSGDAAEGTSSQPTKKRSPRLWQGIRDKNLADCVEALIGCFLQYGNEKAALTLLFWLGVRLYSKKADIASPQDISIQRPPPPPDAIVLTALNQVVKETHLRRLCAGLEGLEEIIDYKFKHIEHLLQAMTHPSCIDNRITCCYQRLEFLGDAVLDYLVTRHIYNSERKMTPGGLTDLRSALVNNNLFAALTVQWGLHKFLKYSDPHMFRIIPEFAKKQEESNHNLRFVEFDGDKVEKVVMKVLGDVMESLAGAIFVDSEYSLSTTWRVFKRLMARPLEEFSKDVPKNPIRMLYEKYPGLTFSKPKVQEGTCLVQLTARINNEEHAMEERSARLCKLALARKLLQ